MKVPVGDEHSVQRVAPFFVANAEFDLGGRFRFEDRQTGADIARFLDEQSELISQFHRFDADLDSRLGVPVRQQATD